MKLYSVSSRHYGAGGLKTLKEAEEWAEKIVEMEKVHGCHPSERKVDIIIEPANRKKGLRIYTSKAVVKSYKF
jgi:hypothetical protein